MAFKLSWNRKVNISRVITKIVITVLALYVGGTILDSVGDIMKGTESPLYGGLTLIGWTIGNYPYNGTHYAATCSGTTYTAATSAGASCITATSGSGVLTVIGIVGLAAVIMEFVVLKMK